MELTVATRSDVGRVRTNNEDSFLADQELGAYIVCDGMGGHAAGEVASSLACGVIQRELRGTSKLREKFLASGKSSDAKALKKAMDQAITAACKEIFRTSSKNAELSGMGTTCTAVMLIGHNKGVLGHVGDSRLYVERQGAVHQLSEDHTYVNELLRRGAITKEAAKNHPQGNVLSRALGVQSSVSVDTMIFDLDPGDVYLLCSDGLYNYFPNSKELGPELARGDLQQGLDNLVEIALDRGGHDNCTVVGIRAGGTTPEADTALAARQRIAILKRIPIFSHLVYNELVKVLGLTQMSQVAAGDDIITEGEKGDEFYVVLAGQVEVVKGDEVLVSLKAGAHLGEMAMIDNARRSATVRAKDDTNLLVMHREEFFGLIRSEPVIATKLLWSFVQVLSGRLRETNEALKGAKEELKSDTEEFEIFVSADDDY